MKEEFFKKLKDYFAAQPVDLVYLFGSISENREKPTSDVDIAILFSDQVKEQERFDLKIKIIGDLSLILKREDIDIVDLLSASPLLKYEAIKNRGEIFIKSESKRVDFEVKTLAEYFDMQYYLKRHVTRGLADLKKEYGITAR